MQVQDYCDRYPCFLETTKTVASRTRLNARWRAVIGWHNAVFAGRAFSTSVAMTAGGALPQSRQAPAMSSAVRLPPNVPKSAEDFSYHGAPAVTYNIVTGDAIRRYA
jgi:hypothetical protein